MASELESNRPPDRRARIHARARDKQLVYGDAGNKNNIMNILHPDVSGSPHGLVFPYTPSITYQRSVEYGSYDIVHTNQPFYAYSRTQALKLSVTGDFTAQNTWEARYVLACIHFLSTMTKMQFGSRSQTPGAPPPILLFSAHGNLMFNRMPVVIEDFSMTFDKGVDYVKVEVGGLDDLPSFRTGNPDQNPIVLQGTEPSKTEAGVAWVPSKMSISVQIAQQLTPDKWTREFSWRDFRDGKLLKRGSGWR